MDEIPEAQKSLNLRDDHIVMSGHLGLALVVVVVVKSNTRSHPVTAAVHAYHGPMRQDAAFEPRTLTTSRPIQ